MKNQASHLEIIAKGIKNAGFSKGGKLSATSVNVYGNRWRIFADWYSKHKINPWRSSMQQIAEFLLHLFDVEKLKVRTI